jgi:hypothetical protein
VEVVTEVAVAAATKVAAGEAIVISRDTDPFSYL